MAQHDYIISNQSGAGFRSDLNNALAAIVSQNSGASEPSTTYAYQFWADTTAGVLKQRNAANNAWITLFQLDGEWSTIALENGTAAAPSLYFKDSGTDTGVYSPGTDQVGIATAGVQRVNFNGSTEVVFNDGGADVDFRIEGDTEPNLFVVDAGTDQVRVANLNGGPLAGARNRIINGNFDIWQRGTSTGSWVAPISDYYYPDRWVFNSSGTGGNGSVSRQAFTVGQTDVPGEPTYFMRWQITSAASGQTSGSCYAEQRIEDVRTLAGQTATISFYAKGTGTLPNIFLTQTFGSGGSTQVALTLATNVALNANWTKYTYTVNVGSISGKTIGTNHYVGLTFMVPLNSTYTFDLAQVQVEQGSVATPFERRNYAQEVRLCQRYFVNTRSSSQFGLGLITCPAVLTSRIIIPYSLFPVVMRATPTMTVYSVNADTSGAVVLYNVASTAVGSGFTIFASSSAGMPTSCNGSASLTIGNYYSFTYEASAEL